MIVAISHLLLAYTLKIIIDSLTDFIQKDFPPSLLFSLCIFLGMYAVVEFITALTAARKALYERIQSELVGRFIIKDLCR
ncbi:MAG: hypothetical protein QME64_10465, partial [bacterium]|nr:hypothetical protein [bacterium]